MSTTDEKLAKLEKETHARLIVMIIVVLLVALTVYLGTSYKLAKADAAKTQDKLTHTTSQLQKKSEQLESAQVDLKNAKALADTCKQQSAHYKQGIVDETNDVSDWSAQISSGNMVELNLDKTLADINAAKALTC